MNRNPRLDLPLALSLCLATVAACVTAGYVVAAHLYDVLHPPMKESQ